MDEQLASAEANFVEAQIHLANALIRLRLAQEQHDRMFGKGSYQRAVTQIVKVFEAPPPSAAESAPLQPPVIESR